MDFETLQENVVSASCEELRQVEGATLEFHLDNPIPQIDTDTDLVCIEERTETLLPTSTTGIEEVGSPDIGLPENDEAIVDGFPGQSTKPHVMNGSATPTTPSTTEEGFEELTTTMATTITEELSTSDKKDTDTDLVCVEEPTETLLSTSTAGIEEVTLPDIGPPENEDAIVDGFPGQSIKPHVMNGSATSTTEEGFEEVTTTMATTKEELSTSDKKDESLRSPLALWMMKQNLHPQVIRLIYWVELQRSTGVFGGILFLLLSLKYYSVIGVITTFALSLLVVAFLYRIGMTIVKAVQKTSAEHPFKHLLEEKIEISEETAQKLASDMRSCINERIGQAQCLFLVKDTVASLKAMVTFWLVSYVAGCINFLTLCILGTIVVFTIPKLYEEKQAEIDQLFSLVMSKTCMLCGIIEQKLPEKIKIYLKKDKKE